MIYIKALKKESSGIENSKLTRILETLSKKEADKFVDFVKSPFYNKKKQLVNLIDLIVKKHPHYDHKSLTKENLYKKAFNQSHYKDSEFNNSVSNLIKLAEQYVTVTHLESSSSLYQFTKISAYNAKGYNKGILSISKQLNNSEKDLKKSGEYFLYDYLIEEEYDAAYGLDNNLPFENSIVKKSEDLDVFYIYTKLKIYTEMLTREKILNVKYKKTFFKEIEKLYSQLNDEQKGYQNIKLYFELVKMLTNEEDENCFEELNTSIILNKEKIGTLDLANFIQHASNYCIRRVNAGHSEYLQKLFDIIKFQSENNILVIDGVLHDRTLKNVIAVAIRVKEFQWAKDFLEFHIQFVSSKNLEMIHDYNLAYIHFGEGDYKSALKRLTFVNIKGPFYQVDARILLIKIYFELEDDISLESAIPNFKSYLKREKDLSTIHKELYNRFLKVVSSLSKIRSRVVNLNDDLFQKKLAEIRLIIDSSQGIADRNWLLKILTTLLNK